MHDIITTQPMYLCGVIFPPSKPPFMTHLSPIRHNVIYVIGFSALGSQQTKIEVLARTAVLTGGSGHLSKLTGYGQNSDLTAFGLRSPLPDTWSSLLDLPFLPCSITHSQVQHRIKFIGLEFCLLLHPREIRTYSTKIYTSMFTAAPITTGKNSKQLKCSPTGE